MDTKEIIAQIDSEISHLQQAKTLLSGTQATKGKLGRPKASNKVAPPVAAKRTMSPEGRARIAAAQKARWAKQKKVRKAA